MRKPFGFIGFTDVMSIIFYNKVPDIQKVYEMKRGLMLLLVMLCVGMSVSAQVPDPFAPYEGIPFERTADGAFILGDPDAPITVVEFADFMCPHCQNYHSTVTQFIEQYVKTGQARLEYRLFPIVHPTYSVYTAQLAECVEQQREGAFWPASDVLYNLAEAGDIGPETAEVLGDALDMSGEKLEVCAAEAVQHETDLALGESMGVSGTPAVLFRNSAGELGWAYVNEQVYNRGGLPLEALELIITAESPDNLVLVPRSQLVGLVELEGCVAPCWRDIVPGESDFTGVVEVIRADRQFYEIGEQDETDGAQLVSWQSINSGIGEPSFIISDAEGVVDVISILEVSTLTLGEVLDVQGQPEYALASRNNNGGAIVYTFFPEKTMIVLSFAVLEDGLTPEATVIGAQFFSETRFKELLTAAVPANWEGFEALEEYFQE